MDISQFIKDVVKADDEDLADIDKLDFSKLDLDVEEVVEWLEKKYGVDRLEDIKGLWLDGGITGDSSFVANPAQQSELFALKDEKDRKKFRANKAIKQDTNKDRYGGYTNDDNDTDRMVSVAPILVPEVDKEGELIPPQLVEKMTDEYMKNIENRQNNVSFDHNGQSGKGTVVRVWTTLKEREFETIDGDTKTYPKNTAIFAIEHNSSLDYDTVKNGNIEGLSMEGYKIPVDPDELRKKIKGMKDETKSMSNDQDTDTDEQETNVELSEDVLDQYEDKEEAVEDFKEFLSEDDEEDADKEEDTEEANKDTEDEDTQDEGNVSNDVSKEIKTEIQALKDEIEEMKQEDEEDADKEEDYDDEDDEDEEEEEDDDASKDTDTDEQEDTQKSEDQDANKDVIDRVFGMDTVDTQKSENQIEADEDNDDATEEANKDVDDEDDSDDPIDKVF